MPHEEVEADPLVGVGTGGGQVGVPGQPPEGHPEHAVAAEGGRAERVPLGELPQPGRELGDTAVGEREAEHHGLDRGGNPAGVDRAENERGEREPRQPEGRGVGDMSSRDQDGSVFLDGLGRHEASYRVLPAVAGSPSRILWPPSHSCPVGRVSPAGSDGRPRARRRPRRGRGRAAPTSPRRPRSGRATRAPVRGRG